jgi:hypothetical protein
MPVSVPVRLRAAAVAVALCMLPAAAAAQVQPYRSVVPPTARTDAGLFHVHRVNDRLLFEIPDSVLGRDMALMSRYAAAQQGLADGGDRMSPNLVVRWERRGERIVLRAVSHETTAEEGSPLRLAVENSNFPPVLQAFPLRARGEDTSVIDVTDLYLGDVPAFSLPRAARTRLGVRAHDRDRSWLEWARSFPHQRPRCASSAPIPRTPRHPAREAAPCRSRSTTRWCCSPRSR